MPVEVSWYIEDRIIYSSYSGNVTIDDVRKGTQAVKKLAYEGTPLVHNIADMLEIDTFPKNIRQIRSVIEQLDNNILGWTLIINHNKLLRFIVSSISQLAKARFRIFESGDEALDFLYRMDTSLPKQANR